MTTKTSVAEWIAYCESPFPQDSYFEDLDLKSVVDGKSRYLDDDQNTNPEYLVTLGFSAPLKLLDGWIVDGSERLDLEDHFLAWRKNNATLTVALSVPSDKAADLAVFLRDNGFDVPENLAVYAPVPESTPSP